MPGEEQTDDLRRRNRELQILNQVAETLNASADLETLMHRSLAQVAELLDLRTGWVFLLNEASGEPYLAAAQNLPPALEAEPLKMAGSCYCLDTFQEGDLQGAANVSVVTCSRLKKLVDGTDGLRFHASIPLYGRGRKLGVLNVASPEWRQLDADSLRLLHTIGDMLGLAIERAHLYARSLAAGAAEERNRLAREIHDTLAQGLAAITLQLEASEALLDAGAEPQSLRRTIRTALMLARDSLDEARRSVLDLRAAPLEGRSLDEALAALCNEVGDSGDATVTYTPPVDRRPLATRLEVGLYRIAQEAINNALKHAAARSIELRLDIGRERVDLTIEDDGRGFDPDQPPPDRYGLIGLRERSSLLDGRLELESSPGLGTRVNVSIPVAAEPV